MPDKVSVDEAAGIIKVDSFGEVSEKDIAASMATIQEVYAEKGFHRVLVDTTRQETMPTTPGIFELFSAFPSNFRCVLLVEEGQATEDDMAFVETVAVNRGTPMRIFYDEQEAIQWLQSGDADD